MSIYDFTLQVEAVDHQFFVRSDCPLITGSTGLQKIDSANLNEIFELTKVFEDQQYLTSAPLDLALAIGDRIYQMILTESIRESLAHCRRQARREMNTLRLIIRLPSRSLLQEIPWELMHDSCQTFALDPWVTIIRHVDQGQREHSLSIDQRPIRVLFTSACPREEKYQIDVDQELEVLRTALAPLGSAVRLTPMPRISKAELAHTLVNATRTDQPFHIWHHCGHGGQTSSGKEFRLLFEKDGNREPVGSREIIDIMSAAYPLKVVLLNTCYSGIPSGLATNLAEFNIPASIGFRNQILDQVALDFARVFYGELLHNPIDIALQHARRSLFDPIRPLDWLLPILFLRAHQSSLR